LNFTDYFPILNQCVAHDFVEITELDRYLKQEFSKENYTQFKENMR